jgi:hypothetical protein
VSDHLETVEEISNEEHNRKEINKDKNIIEKDAHL